MRSDEKAYKRYKSKKWRAFRESFLKENPICKNFAECHNFAEHVDHIKRIESEDDPLFYDKNNLQALCKRCHSRKTAKEDFFCCFSAMTPFA
ncbi:HNH endonuclease signature motif containing protein [Brachyspira hyodysenteriae]|uniref:HNH endonuclease signature motif containing protein n=1 Tax=Brachyspira hyodysenteriae TaxID=159 RepID=UPI0022CD4C88|nr:HNH endonuclease signature motif containing protein [Brachyspira hyodysenteriae]MCZ9839079.1 HNH endonuclease [Brachyspira hyodysenteriae]